MSDFDSPEQWLACVSDVESAGNLPIQTMVHEAAFVEEGANFLRKAIADNDRLASDLQATRAELERVRRSQLRRMRREALEWADRMTWGVPSKESVEWVRRNRPRLMRFAERCRTALAAMETGRA